MIPEPRNIDGVAEWATSKPLGAAWDTEELRAGCPLLRPDGKNLKIVATACAIAKA